MKEYTNNEVANEVAEPQAVYNYTPEEVLLYDGLSAEELRRIEIGLEAFSKGHSIKSADIHKEARQKYGIGSNEESEDIEIVPFVKRLSGILGTQEELIQKIKNSDDEDWKKEYYLHILEKHSKHINESIY